ncbi:cysteine--tRNA ligase [Rickettsia endosymbiont of Cardiosporidium cionae]|uniref:cysteine--tRNA ligase n=1 Tax=Rickettsia endosymbiont of Cardiosporidium cionae TaxID=2777155 RepID=UPI0018960C76|nr:cysteine--tRNA ligase [Rickettsia endosymbiont of Cardiosporidium cionae]KAF8818334.1 cysteine--tRNA ligase [Rickettsia endosymbiont of Cardiosporidium cionae]
MHLYLLNSLSKKKELFIPLNQNSIKFYACGPTVYDKIHIGNARAMISYDILYRILIFLYGKHQVIFVRNITDIDDKIIKKSEETNISIAKLTENTINDFQKDMEFLKVIPPTVEPKATEVVEDIINFIQILLNKKYAYISNNNVFFDVTKAKNYTMLSGRNLDELSCDIRIKNDPNKKQPNDFVLWKASNPDDPKDVIFSSPFGKGRPGWHIECSAMSYKYLGTDFDIHAGGMDLIFPHHTNEIAQSQSAFTGSNFARYWVHNAVLTVDQQKMSKSLGNIITVNDIRNSNIKADSLRLFFLNSHYRNNINYCKKSLDDAHRTLSYWHNSLKKINYNYSNSSVTDIPKKFLESILDNMNTSLAIKIINDHVKELNITNGNQQQSLANMIIASARFLGLMEENYEQWFHNAQTSEKKETLLSITELIDKRNKARKIEDWITADKIRNILKEKYNITIEDNKDGTSNWKYI